MKNALIKRPCNCYEACLNKKGYPSMPKIEYPLKQVLEVKERRVSEAEKVVKDRVQALEKEKEILTQKEKERDKASDHHKAKLTQLRKELDSDTTSPKIQQMKDYLKVTKERLNVEEKKVKEQKQKVDAAQKNLDDAKEELRLKRLEVDKLNTHKKDWLKEMRKEQEIMEEREQDELGSIIFTSQHYKKSE